VRHDPVRDEAERLVAAAIAAVSLAARGIPKTGSRAIATGSDECCVCPVCRVIAAMRDPSVEMTERLSAGAGDLATAVTGVLRMLSRATGGGHPASAPEEEPTREGDEFWESMRRKAADAARNAARTARGEEPTDPWRTATSGAGTKPMAKKAVAKKAVKKAAGAAGPVVDPTTTVPPGAVAGQSEPAVPPAASAPLTASSGDPSVTRRPIAKKAVAKKAVAKKAVAKAEPPAVAKKAVAKKAVAKKTVAKKAAPPPRETE